MVLGIKYGRVAYLQRWEHHQQLEEETGFCLITVQLLGYCVGALNTLMVVMVMMVMMVMVMVMGIITVHHQSQFILSMSIALVHRTLSKQFDQSGPLTTVL